jgi:light-regulated signal transduction histidine kinase (bacteriophytochrome)
MVLIKAAGHMDETSRSYLKRVIAATRDMTQLIDALLSLSQVTSSELLRRPISLSILAQTVIDELTQSSSNRSTEIVIQSNLMANADSRLLRIVLTNLLGNAWKFTGKTARPCLEFGATDSDGLRTYFVRDNGAGFDMAYASRLFGAFQRLHSSEDFEGTGIGLATVQRIIRRHGGKVWAKGAPQQGATFYFTLSGDIPQPATGAHDHSLRPISIMA